MATASTADSATNADADGPGNSGAAADEDSSSVADRLETAATVVWWSFLAAVVVFTLIPVVAVWFGAVPFAPPPTTPYFAFVGLALIGTAALIGAELLDV